MKREEAVTCLKEITCSCANMSPNAVTLTDPKLNDPLAVGYQVKIKTILDSETKQQVQQIAKKYNLALKEGEEEIIIYRPRES
jgi:hypothetical protein